MKTLLAAGTIALATACAPPPVLHYATEAIACNATPGYAGPERCVNWSERHDTVRVMPGPFWVWEVVTQYDPTAFLIENA